MNPNFENFKIGDFITVLQGQKLNPYTGFLIGDGLMEQESREDRYDNSYKGEVLEIMAIDYPYIVLRNRSNNNNILNLDLRLTKFKALSKEYVNALIGDKL